MQIPVRWNGRRNYCECLCISSVCANSYEKRTQIFTSKSLIPFWCARRDSNARPLAPEANALSDWATGAEFPRKGTLQSWKASSCAASCQAVCSGTGSVLRLVWCRSRVFVSIRLLRFPFFFFILRSIPWAFPLLGTVIPILRFLAATWLFS